MLDLGFNVFDADNHLYEPREALTEYLPKKYRRQVRYVEVDGRTKLALCGHISDYIPNPTFDVVARPGAYSDYLTKGGEGKTMREIGRAEGPMQCLDGFREPAARLALMDEQGLHATLVWGTLVTAIEERMKHNADLLHAALHAFNCWLDQAWGFERDGRLFAVPMLTLMDVDKACEELDWCLERGARIVGIRPAPVPGYRGSRSPGLPEFDPFWARVCEAGIPVGMHGSDSGYDQYAAAWEPSDEFLPFEMSPLRRSLSATPIHDTFAAMICHELFERHQNLRVVSVENGAGWLPALLRRLEAALPDRDPRGTFKRHVWVALSPGDRPELIREQIGSERMLFGSDFPHPEGLAEPLRYRDKLEGFTPDDVRSIMSTNLEGLLRPQLAA